MKSVRPYTAIVRLLTPMLLLLAWLLPTGEAQALSTECRFCHDKSYNDWSNSRHATFGCETCHENADTHMLTPVAVKPKVHFDSEVCRACHPDQYNSFNSDNAGKTTFGGGSDPVTLWPKTLDLPYWNSLIDGHPFVIETFEERNMMWNQIDTQLTLRPMAESCLACHGTKVAYYMGITGLAGFGAGQTRTIETTQRVWSGNFEHWQVPLVPWIEIPAGTTVSTTIDTVDPVNPHQVETVVTLPDGRVYASFSLAGATATGNDPDPVTRTEARNYCWAALQALSQDGLDATYDPAVEMYVGPNANSANAAVVCTMCHDPMSTRLRVIQKSLLWSINEYGINPYSNVPIPPDPPGPPPVKDFTLASRQDQIIAVCGQCHAEYVGGYSAIDNIDRQYFPWAKPTAPLPPLTGVGERYQDLFGYNQDWIHGVGVRPWQSADPGLPGYAPAGSLAPMNIPLAKMQHPEAEAYWNSMMYMAGATCTDCHAIKVARTDGTSFTNHSFTSPVKLLLQGKNPCVNCHYVPGPGQPPPLGAPWDVDALLDNIRFLQDTANDQQNAVQLALVEAQKVIAAQAPGPARDANVALYQAAHLRWEWHANAENSMGFHNSLDTMNELNEALRNANLIVTPGATLAPPYGLLNEGAMAADPLANPPIPANAVSLLWISAESGADANGVYNGLAFEVQRQEAVGGVIDPGAWVTISPAGGITGVVQDANTPPPTPNTYVIDILDPTFPPEVMWDDANNVVLGTNYAYRVRAIKGGAFSVWTPPVQALAIEAALAPMYVQGAAVGPDIVLHWFAEPGGQAAFRIDRAMDRAFTQGLYSQYAPGTALTGFTDATVAPNTTYFYRVRAEDPLGNSAFSPTISLSSSGPPPAPWNLTAAFRGPDAADLRWGDISGRERGFRVERALDDTFLTGVVPSSLGPNYSVAADAGLAGDTRYYYRAVAFNDLGDSPYSVTASLVTLPSAPTAFVASSAGPFLVNLSWSDTVATEDGFVIERALAGGAPVFADIGQVGPNVTAYADATVQSKTPYVYRIRAFNASGTALSSTAAVITPPNLPQAPTGLRAPRVLMNQVRLRWSDTSNNELGFEIQRRRAVIGALWKNVGRVGAGVTLFVDLKVASKMTYAYRVRAFNADGKSRFSNVLRVTTP